MVRMARVVVPNYPHHFAQRGNHRQQTFFCDDDCLTYLEQVSKFCRKADMRVWAYCLTISWQWFGDVVTGRCLGSISVGCP